MEGDLEGQAVLHRLFLLSLLESLIPYYLSDLVAQGDPLDLANLVIL